MKYFSIFGIVFLVWSFQSPVSAWAAAVARSESGRLPLPQVEQLHRMGAWNDLLKSMEGFRWQGTEDLAFLLPVSEALAETRGDINRYTADFRLPRNVERFLRAHHAMMSGRFAYARQQFELLTKETPARELGVLGKLEYSTRLSNLKLLRAVLAEARAVRDSQFLIRKLWYYEIMAAVLSENEREVERLVRKHDEFGPEYQVYLVPKLLDHRLHGRAKTLIDKYAEKLGYDRILVPIVARWISSTEGPEERLNRLASMIGKYPDDWQLRRQHFAELMRRGQRSDAQRAFNYLLREHGSKPEIAADRLNYFGDDLMQSGELEAILTREASDFADSPEYLVAKAGALLRHLKKLEQSKRLIARATEFNPAMPSIPLMRAEIANAENRPLEEIKWLRRYLKMNPADEEVRKEVEHLLRENK